MHLLRIFTPFCLLFSSLARGQNNDCNATEVLSGFPPCDALISAGLKDRVILPSSERYEARVNSYWSANARLRPWCFVLPHTTEEVSQIIRVLSRSSSGTGDWHIAIKSGGHHLPGVSSIANGVTIDLAMMNSSSYNPQTGLASIQPGARWGDVYYNLLRTANVTVMGGRDGGVGVGGFLLGGGISFHTGRHGFACNAVVNMEIVLANGSIISTNENEHPGLFKSLKGGSSNFGIVTRFDVETMPAVDIGFGISVFSSNHSEDIQRAFVDFTDAQEENKDDALVTLYSYGGGESSNASRIILRVNTQGDLETPSFDKFNEIPAIHSTWERISLPDALNGSSVTTITRNAWTALTIPNDIEVLQQHNLLFNEMVSSLKAKIGADNFAIQGVIQPLPHYVTTIAPDGNVLGADRSPGNKVLWTSVVSISGGDNQDAALAVAQAELNVITTRLKSCSLGLNGSEWTYLNYAGANQDPLGSYGPENVAFMKKVAAEYDPKGFWQKMIPGGFKLQRVDVA